MTKLARAKRLSLWLLLFFQFPKFTMNLGIVIANFTMNMGFDSFRGPKNVAECLGKVNVDSTRIYGKNNVNNFYNK